MDELNEVLDTLDSASGKVYQALSKAVIKSINEGDKTALLQAIGMIAGRELSAEKLLIALRDEIKA